MLPLYAALSEVRVGEIACLQVLFQPVAMPWGEHVFRAIHTERGEPFFLDAPEFTKVAGEKAAQPLFASVVRLAVKARDAERAWSLMRGASGGLLPMADWNELLPLSEDEEIDLEADLLQRTTHRSGMLLGLDELAGLVHPPHESVRLAKLPRQVRGLEGPAVSGHGRRGHARDGYPREGRRTVVRLPRDLRMRHVHVVGASGSGKSTLLTQMILDDLDARRRGRGPRPPRRPRRRDPLPLPGGGGRADLILFDPGDEEVSFGWNMLAAQSEIEKTLLASDLVRGLPPPLDLLGRPDELRPRERDRRLPRIPETVGTLLELRRFLVDREFRAAFLRPSEDPEVRYYWQKEFPLLVGKPQGPILTRLDTFLRPKLVRRVVVERENRLDFRGMVDRGQVFLAKALPRRDRRGERRAPREPPRLRVPPGGDLPPGPRARRPAATSSSTSTSATSSRPPPWPRSFRVRGSTGSGLTLAHQELASLRRRTPEVASALLGNAATRIVFRVGERDARELAGGLRPSRAADLLSLGVGEAIARVERRSATATCGTPRAPARSSPAAASERREPVSSPSAGAVFPRRASRHELR